MPAFFVLALVLNGPAQGETFRSKLYPSDWAPKYRQTKDNQFLHDFSFAGYNYGKEIPNVQKNVIDVTKAPYHADNTGISDSTRGIQAAINQAGLDGGGVVYLPAGTYKVSPATGKCNNKSLSNRCFALGVHAANVIIRGDGPGITHIHNTATNMHNKSVILVSDLNSVSWASKPSGPSVRIKEDVPGPTFRVSIKNSSRFSVGEYVVLRSQAAEYVTTDWLNDVSMASSDWGRLKGYAYLKKIVHIDRSKNHLYFDTPVTADFKVRDRARIYKPNTQPIIGNGVEYLSIGMSSNLSTELENYTKGGSPKEAYNVDHATAIRLFHAAHGWIRYVSTYNPGNTSGHHIMSLAYVIDDSKNITVEHVLAAKTHYRGGGGNGNYFGIRGGDILSQFNVGLEARHTISFSSQNANNNVVRRSTSFNPSHGSDFHKHLAWGNLVIVFGQQWQCRYRTKDYLR
jgi:hypothetical protein